MEAAVLNSPKLLPTRALCIPCYQTNPAEYGKTNVGLKLIFGENEKLKSTHEHYSSILKTNVPYVLIPTCFAPKKHAILIPRYYLLKVGAVT